MESREQLSERLDTLKEKIGEVAVYIDLERKNERIKELRDKTMDPDFWQDNLKAQKITKEISDLEYEIKRWNTIQELREDADLHFMMSDEDPDLLKEIPAILDKLEDEITSLETEKLLSGEYDRKNAIFVIHPGAGGTESQDWADMLFRMYTRWFEKRGFEYTVLNYQPGDEAGIKEAVIEVKGPYAYGYLSAETGVHRLVRISPFDSNARRHTSFASVFVYPEADDDIDIEINPKDLRIDTYRASGAGGQHVNKTDSAIRITHIPTGIVSTCQNERSQHKNKEMAMKILKSRLYQLKKEEEKSRKADLEKDKMEIGWGSQIRSYVFQPYTLVKDNRTKYETGNIQAVMDGDLDGFVKAWLTYSHSQQND
ncbi:MAG: peptide chain release factor 2 [Candidatus Marinimicrobia bacterium]|jgi:peptide chain release factor 2|nr:peptide chain release factor 2 [Candidatus Neomarinimicrobiota bacterium]